MNTPLQENKPAFVYVTYIRTTPEKLWEALTSGDLSEKYWFGYRMQTDWKPGADFRFRAPDGNHDKNWVGKVLEYKPFQRLSYSTYLCTDKNVTANKRNGPTTVTYELEAMGSMVRLRLIHENLIVEDFENSPNTWKGINNGWPAVMSGLKSLLETGEASVYQPKN